MDWLMVLLRIVHVVTAVFWVGSNFLLVGFAHPTAKKEGVAGQEWLKRLYITSNLGRLLGAAALLTIISGLWMYWRISGFRAAYITSTYGAALAIGGLFAIIAFIVAAAITARSSGRVEALDKQIRAVGGTATPEQQAELEALWERIRKGDIIHAILLVVVVIAMSSAQYLRF